MAASPEVSQTVPPEDLEEGELPSSEDEEGEIDESSNEKGNDDSSKANDSVNYDDESIPTVTSKRPFESPEREIEPNDDKITKPKVSLLCKMFHNSIFSNWILAYVVNILLDVF